MFVAVIKKRSRLKNSFKYWGGVLNTEAVHGKGYYTRRIAGNDVKAIGNQLSDIIQGKKEHV